MPNNWSVAGHSATPLNIAHRGASKVAPPNTLAAFEKAVRLGADGIELDVHLSADGVPVVIHDATVDATTDGHGHVAAMSLAQIQQLDAGSWFDPTYAGERIPTLDQVLHTVGDRLLVNVELKTVGVRDRGLERATIGVIQARGMADRVLLSSFNPFSLWRAKHLAPHIPVGLLYARGESLPLLRIWTAVLLPHEARHPEHTLVNASHLVRARQHGYRVHTWTVDEPQEMCRLIELGVDGIITNVPDVLREVLAHY